MESAVTLTKGLRWDIQALGVRLAKAATAEESSRRKKTNSKAAHEVEIHLIVKDIKSLLVRIEDAVPLINLAITTSGASLSTTLPASVSPSRLLQASTFLTAGDTQYSMNPTTPVQVGPAFTLSLYMLFAGHSYRVHDSESMRETTWKEVIHKARVKLMRIPLQHTLEIPILETIENGGTENPMIAGDGRQNEYAYHIEMIEDLEDDRVHTFDDDEAQPGPYGDVQLAGIRDFLPIYQISKIFYADTGKILNIGNQGETNNPVLLLKRDINAQPPRRMMEEGEKGNEWYDEPTPEPETLDGAASESSGTEEGDSQDDIDQQLRRESTVPRIQEIAHEQQLIEDRAWRLPADLDAEWMALEVYTESEDSSSEDGLDVNDDSAYMSHRPSSSREEQVEENLADGLAHLNLDSKSSPSPSTQQLTSSSSFPKVSTPKPSPLGPIRSSLSLLEMLIRLTALQQFQQASHLSIPDELLTFFLEESSTTGAGGDGEERRRTRREARQKVGFDPYDESPVKRRGEDYQYQNQGQDGYAYSRGGTPYQEYDQNDGYPLGSPRWSREQSQSMPPQGTPEPWLLRSREGSGSRRGSPDVRPSSPVSPYRPQRRTTRPLDRVQGERGTVKGSPLGRGVSVGTDSTLGTSPGSPTLVDRNAKV